MRRTNDDIHSENKLPSICPMEEFQERFGTL